jgi:hypothetical protein
MHWEPAHVNPMVALRTASVVSGGMRPGKIPSRNNARNVPIAGGSGLQLAFSRSLLVCCCYSCACVPLPPNLSLLSLFPVILVLPPPCLGLAVLLLIIPGNVVLHVVRSSLQKFDAHPR